MKLLAISKGYKKLRQIATKTLQIAPYRAKINLYIIEYGQNMTEPLLTPQQEAILIALSKNESGAKTDDILASFKGTISLRNLQRHLATLVKKNHILRIGKGRATIYKLQTTFPTSKEAEKAHFFEEYIPVSEDSRDILDYVRRPLIGRNYVSYDRNFLSDYKPNHSAYLGDATRLHLHKIGNTNEMSKPAGTYGREILNRLIIDLSWASSQLEGNTYSRLDTVQLIEFGKFAQGKDAQETQMILNHKAAINFLVENINLIGFNNYTFLSLHGLLSENLLPDPDASGRLRLRPVEITGSVYKPIGIPQIINDVFTEILLKAEQIENSFEQAFFIMVHVPYLQPFEDVNKRVSRLAANIPLLKQNLCPLTFLDVPERAYVEATLGVYEMTRISLLRDLFVWAYERSSKEYLEVSKSLAQPDPIRLRYRQKIHELVGKIVRESIINTIPEIDAFTKANITENDQAAFIEVVLDDLKRLHEGVLARYQIQPADFAKWQKRRMSTYPKDKKTK